MGSKPLPVTAFRQMCGRAGRFGLDDYGEAILMVSNSEEKRQAKQLICSELDPLKSVLHSTETGGLEKLLLELICYGKLQHEIDVESFVTCTLMSVQHFIEEVSVI